MPIVQDDIILRCGDTVCIEQKGFLFAVDTTGNIRRIQSKLDILPTHILSRIQQGHEARRKKCTRRKSG